MSSNVGLSTPRGSGTSGYVQRNLSVLKPRTMGAGAPYAPFDSNNNSRGPPRTRKPDEDILKHDRLREIEIAVLELRDRLEDEGDLDDERIDEECETLRKRLVDEADKKRARPNGRNGNLSVKAGRDGIKKYQVHELAEAKIRESDRLRRALGLRNDDVGNGGGDDDNNVDATRNQEEHPMARQERRKRERELERARLDGLKNEKDETYTRSRDYD